MEVWVNRGWYLFGPEMWPPQGERRFYLPRKTLCEVENDLGHGRFLLVNKEDIKHLRTEEILWEAGGLQFYASKNDIIEPASNDLEEKKREMKTAFFERGHGGKWRCINKEDDVWLLVCPRCGAFAYINNNAKVSGLEGGECKKRKKLRKTSTKNFRICLNCGKVFLSEGKFNRLCSYCRSTTDRLGIEPASLIKE